jgi:tellurite resistance protein
MTSCDTPLRHLLPGWFASVTGWSGLAPASHRPAPAPADAADAADGAALAAGAIAPIVFVLLLAGRAPRGCRPPWAVRADLAHPLRGLRAGTLFVAAAAAGIPVQPHARA